MPQFTIKTVKPKATPEGYRKFPYCTGKYKNSILGKVVEHEQPVWAERRLDHGALFESDRIYYKLYTFTKN